MPLSRLSRRGAVPVTICLLYVRDAEGEWPLRAYATPKEVERAEVEATLEGRYQRVSWEEKVLQDPRGSWNPSRPLYVVTDGVYEVTVGVFGDHRAALACASAQPPGAVTRIRTMHVTACP